jgi:uncharacterized protein YecT (DUF1311 family)
MAGKIRILMRLAAALVVLTIAVPAEVSADELDGWCAQVQKASSIVICSDVQLRAETLKRQKLFDLLKERLTPDPYKALLADQNSWVKTYTARCGVSLDDLPPSLPISSNVVDCYLRESRLRTADLTRRYSWALPQEIVGTPVPSPAAPSTTRPKTSAMPDVAVEAWYACLYDAADTLSQQPEPASVVVEAALGSCVKYKIAYRESVPGLTWDHAEEVTKTIVSPRILARVMTVRAARAKLREEKRRHEPQADFSRM